MVGNRQISTKWTKKKLVLRKPQSASECKIEEKNSTVNMTRTKCYDKQKTHNPWKILW